MEILPKLTPAQSVLLRTAARRPDGRVIPPDTLRGGARVKVLTSLLQRGWIEPADDGHVMTDAGYTATRASQAELERQRDAIQVQLAGLPDTVRKARDHFIHCRAAMAEIELHEQLMPVMNALARASAARRQINYHHDESRFPVEIPRALIEAAGDALAAEMPAA